MKNITVTDWCRQFIRSQIQPGDLCIDATMGNGNDTALLCQLTGPQGHVLAFDIQEQALVNTQERLEKLGLQDVRLILDGHQHVDQYVETVKAAIFNLGYLPSADKSVITLPATTIEAMEKICTRLQKGGRMAIMIYYGHEGGDIERDAVLDFVSQLPQKDYTATIYRTLNQVNQPPFLVMIEKLESYRHG